VKSPQFHLIIAMVSAVVFGYHNVGVRCLSVLLAHNIQVKLVVTHSDDEGENIWFDSVKEFGCLHGIPVISPQSPNTESLISQMRALQPDFIFSFYYRSILSVDLLSTATLACYNMHGSLLPKYRGRVPVNWAIIQGETETGATLHEMVKKPDAGAIVGQMIVPILPNDTAADVFAKVLVAAELVLDRALPSMVNGTLEKIPMDVSKGSYFGGRKPADGKIDWKIMGAKQIHNLVRAVSHPYPGAFTHTSKGKLVIWRTILMNDDQATPPIIEPCLWEQGGLLLAVACDGMVLRIISAVLGGHELNAKAFLGWFDSPLMLV
jgi:methionyl-tRNA formyltransferase